MPEPPATAAQQSREPIEAWLAAEGASAPAAVRMALTQHLAVVEGLTQSERKLRGVLAELRRRWGIAPRSERRRSGEPLGAVSGKDGKRPRTLREKLQANVERLGKLSRWHGKIARRQAKQMKRSQKKLEKLPPLDEVKLTAKEEREADAEAADLMNAFAAGDGADPSLQPADETLMSGSAVSVEDACEHVSAPEPSHGEQVVETRHDSRVRYDFEVTLTRVEVAVEKKIVVTPDGSRRVLSASTASLGPARYAVTWGFLANLALLVGQYCMPFHRVGRLLSTPIKSFTTTSLSRMVRYVAERFSPIYLHLFDQLADAPVLSGDDTPPRVLEVRRHFAREGPEEPTPWAPYQNCERARACLVDSQSDYTFEAQLAAEMGFEFPQRTGKGVKTSLNTTALSGRSDPSDPRSRIVLYRTHLGGLGNLLEVALSKRSPYAKDVVIQSDLATVNLVTDKALLARFAIVHAGCSAHARRPFAQYEHDDPELATYMLNFFTGIAIHEHGLDVHGRNRENVLRVRGVHSRRTWESIRELAEIMTHKWSKQTHLGAAARYILRHYDKLTAYLDDPRLSDSNNFSERMLRMEKLIESGSMFRQSLAGRFSLDILRTVLQTAVAAGAPLREYLEDVLRTPAAEVEAHPERYTPLAWVKRQSENAEAVQGEAPVHS